MKASTAGEVSRLRKARARCTSFLKSRIGRKVTPGLAQQLDGLRDDHDAVTRSVRAKVEQPFRVIKCHFGLTKVRYKGLAKNTAQLITLFALSNPWMARSRLMQRVQA